MKKLIWAIVIGIIAAAYSFLYNYIGDTHRGLLIFASLMAAVSVSRRRMEVQ